VIEQDNHIQTNTVVLPIATGVAGVFVGAALTYFWQRRKLNTVQTTLDELRRRNEREHAKRLEISRDENQIEFDLNDSNPIKVGEEFVKNIMTNTNGDREPQHGTVLNPRGDVREIVVDDPAKINNIFANSPSEEWDYELELQNRRGEFPYIIHRDEFFADEMGNSQSTLTYYVGDDILVDEQNVPIYNYSSVVGNLRFGHGSEDQNVVYIRNEKLKTEYEVIQDSGYYQVEVLGLEIENRIEAEELRHSRRPGRMPRE